MTKLKQKNNIDISPELLMEFRHATLMASTGASVRLSGSKVTDKEVEHILNIISKPSVQTSEYRNK